MTAESADVRLLSPKQVVATGLCVGCGSCAARHGNGAADMVWDRYGQLEPRKAGWLETASPDFNRICPFAPRARDEDELAYLFGNHQGWIEDVFIGITVLVLLGVIVTDAWMRKTGLR